MPGDDEPGDRDAGRIVGPAGLEGRVRRLGSGRRPGRTPSSWRSRPRRSGSSRCGCSTTSTLSPSRRTRSRSSRSRCLAALAMVTSRVRIGHMVVCTGVPQSRRSRRSWPRPSTSSPAAGSSWASAPAGTSTSGSRTATASRRWASGSASWATTSRHLADARAGTGDLRGPLRRGRRGDQRAEGRPAPHPGDRRGQRPAAHRRLCRQVRRRAQLRVPAARAAQGPHRRGPWAVRGGRPRPVRRSASRCTSATKRCGRDRRGSTRSPRCARRSWTGSCCFPGRWDPSPDGQAAFAEDCRAAGFVLGGTAAAIR